MSAGRRLLLLLKQSGAFSPASLSGISVWLDAVDTSTLYQDAAKTTAAGDGDVVGAWADLSVNGVDFTQATTANKPLVDADVLGSGYPGVKFDGNNDSLQAGSKFGLNAVTIYVVLTGVDDNGNAHRPLDLQNDGADPYRIVMQVRHSDNDYIAFFRTGGSLSVTGGSDPAGRHLIILTGADGGNGTLYFDSATTIDGGPSSAGTGWAADSVIPSRLGIDVTGGSPFNGYMHSLIISETEDDATRRGLIGTYLADRYGITLS
jgi:hypothetical protein